MKFSQDLLAWFDHHGRKNLPWSGSKDPYRIWVSEIMLQQTQVTTVISYFNRFIARFPNVKALAEASIDEVLHLWTGLGYYARARNLHKAAQVIVNDHRGYFPNELDELVKLPGIGLSTAGAILAFSTGQRHPILDGNVKRVLTRLHCVQGWPGQNKVQKQLWELADHYTPSQRVEDYTQAIMDLGATICIRKKPHCPICPVKDHCLGYQRGNPGEFPHPAAKKTKPVKRTGMLMIRNAQGEVLLQQRPPSGIWGGLWSFPECEDRIEDKADWEYRQLGLLLKIDKPWTVKRHSFTHFHLDITPIPAKIHKYTSQVMENSNVVWYKPSQPRPIGLAAPVKSLLEKLTLLKNVQNC